MEFEKFITDAVDRLQKSGRDAVKNFIQSKDGAGKKGIRGQIVDWCGLAVQILMEPLEDHEKVTAWFGVQEQITKSGKAPQEIDTKLCLQE